MLQKFSWLTFFSKEGYRERWHVEICIPAFKRMFKEHVISKNYASIFQEFKIKVWIYNMLRLYSLNNRANSSVSFFVIFDITENYRTDYHE
jgi:hypothetical protein